MYEDDFIAYLGDVRGLSPHSCRAYRSDLNHFANWCRRNDFEPLALSHRSLRLYLGELDAAQYARSTIARRMATLRAYYAFLVERGVVEDNPAQLLGTPKRGATLPKTMRASEIARVLEVPDRSTPKGSRDAALLECLYATGARVGELSSLDLQHVDLAAGLLRVTGKGNKERLIPLYPIVIEKLKLYLDEARASLATGETDAVFLSSRGNRLTTDAIRRIVKRCTLQAGIDSQISPHSFRHTFASDLLASGADLQIGRAHV
jgi:integrase/recombinase XerD